MSDVSAGAGHPGFGRMFGEGRLTVGLFLPLRQYAGDLEVLHGQAEIIQRVDESEFAAVWARDVPLFDPGFGDAGQVFDLWTTLAWLSARTQRLALAAGSAIFTLRHPVDLAKQATSIDQLSGGRLVLGVASGDRASEFPAYGIDHATRGERFRDAVTWFRELTEVTRPTITSDLGRVGGGVDLLPKPVNGYVPLVVTGSSQQKPEWIAGNADGWLVYPGASVPESGPRALGARVAAWRELIPGGAFKPVATNEWIDLVEDRHHKPTPLRGGFVLRTGTEGLLELLSLWQEVGINHAALGVQHGRRPPAEVVAQLIEEVVPHFPALAAPAPRESAW